MPIHSDADYARQTENEWQLLRRESSELPYSWAPAYQSLIEAAYAEPVLRNLYPFTSHWALRFSTTTRPELTPTGPCLTANSDGAYGIQAYLPRTSACSPHRAKRWHWPYTT
jgi:hypothetical protein